MQTARIGEVLENPVTGERAVIRITPLPSNGYALVADLYVRPGGAVTGEHIHPGLTETFTVINGQLGIRIDGQETTAGPGDRTHITPGRSHDWWNAGDTEARVLVHVQPGDRFEQMIRQLFSLAQAGRTDATGRPQLLDGVALGREFADTIRFTTPPWFLQRIAFRLLGPIARLTGHQGKSLKDLARAPSFAELEPLPPEILRHVPELADQPGDHTANQGDRPRVEPRNP
jgi:quercetin dioxygenase-like cupin family protein